MSDNALLQIIINKSPVEIKSLLYQIANSGITWDSFIGKTEEVALIAFPDNTFARGEEVNAY